MSGRSGASGSVRSCGGSVRLATTGGGHELVLDALYERKRDKKSVRVLTVIIYVFCVSLAAIMLSLYYVFFWEPKDAQYAQRKVAHTVEKQTSTTPMPTCFMPYTGGNNSTVSENVTQQALGNMTDDSFWIGNDTSKFSQLANFSDELDNSIQTPNASNNEEIHNITGKIT
ncbi:unnamed protein product [Diatraea saccharalis]|uniref:Transmembrane protein INAFM2 n=1 Tax=Diatraea saccharalis TaxID=40085 RepID=A0A9N9R3L2_9NEOP|nr:unnamed protein product [Diatraea saccharalis]